MKKIKFTKNELIELVNGSIGRIHIYTDNGICGWAQGFVFDKPGYFISCIHDYFMNGAKKFEITFLGTCAYNAKLVYRDEETAVCMFKFNCRTKQPLMVGDNAIVTKSTELFVPSFFPTLPASALLKCKLCALHKEYDTEKYIIDVAVNMDDYGSPILDVYGNIVGIVTEDLNHMKGHKEYWAKKMKGRNYSAMKGYLKKGLSSAVPSAFFPTIQSTIKKG